MKNIILLFASALLINTAVAQNLVGMSSDNIMSALKNKGINTDSISTGKNSNGSSYISYETPEKKVIYFIDSTMNCYCYRIVYPYSQLNAILQKLDEKFTQQGRFKWLARGRKNYIIILDPKDDYFVTDMSLEE